MLYMSTIDHQISSDADSAKYVASFIEIYREIDYKTMILIDFCEREEKDSLMSF